MTKVRYIGPADLRELTKADFGKLSVSQLKVTFTKGKVTELSAEVAAALLTHELVSGEFEEVLMPEEAPADQLTLEYE